MDAWREGQKCKESGRLLADLDKEVLMEKIFRAKLAQQDDIRRVLSATKNRELIKVIDMDSYWGTGKDGSGKNTMGKLWMKLRAELQ
jgi:predicted NAD-dependent protein-ADP-ribosyltransferase YbiA (DUF1768 family)